MNILAFHCDKSLVSKEDLMRTATKCMRQIEIIRTRQTEYKSVYASIDLPFDTSMRTYAKQCAQTVLEHEPHMLIIVGIGGSNLGTKAVQEAILGIDNDLHNNLKVYYVDTIDPNMVTTIKNKAEQALIRKKTIIVNIVTKSGTTTETIANGAIFIDLLERYYGTMYKNYLFITTDYGSKLWHNAKKYCWNTLTIPHQVGGRYSVLSCVGLFPLAIMGIDIDMLCAGAASMIAPCTSTDLQNNIAVMSASVLYALYQQGYAIHNFFPFSCDLYSVGTWYRQLMAESIGKECAITGERIQVGITPLTSVGTTDLHSIVELHLGGPDNTVTTFVDLLETNVELSVPQGGPLSGLVPHIEGKSFNSIMKAILWGVKTAYDYKKKPYMSISIPEKTAFYVGQLLQWKMLEIIYLGYLFGIDPFVQPEVELYKKETQNILKNL
jgi:glucose-6-phosphate isomerase